MRQAMESDRMRARHADLLRPSNPAGMAQSCDMRCWHPFDFGNTALLRCDNDLVKWGIRQDSFSRTRSSPAASTSSLP